MAMNKLEIVPKGWPKQLEEYRGGHFVYEKQLCFKTEYHDQNGNIEAYNSAGERFNATDVVVQPVEFVWREYDE